MEKPSTSSASAPQAKRNNIPRPGLACSSQMPAIMSYDFLLHKDPFAQPVRIVNSETKEGKPKAINYYIEGYPHSWNPNLAKLTTKKPLELAPIPEHEHSWHLTPEGKIQLACTPGNCDDAVEKAKRKADCQHPPIMRLVRDENDDLLVKICASGIPITLTIKKNIFDDDIDIDDELYVS